MQQTKYLNKKQIEIMNIKLINMKSKKMVLGLALLLIPMIGFSQSVFDRFEDLDDVSAVVINQRMIQMMGQIADGVDEADDYLDLIKNVSSIKVFATENSAIATDMASTVTSFLKSSNLQELMRVKDDGNNVKIYVKEGKDNDHIKELFMFAKEKGGQSVILSISGDISLKAVSKLTQMLDIPGSEHLKDVKQK